MDETSQGAVIIRFRLRFEAQPERFDACLFLRGRPRLSAGAQSRAGERASSHFMRSAATREIVVASTGTCPRRPVIESKAI